MTTVEQIRKAIYSPESEVIMFGLFEDIVEAVADTVVATTEVAAGVATGVVIGAVKATIVVAEKTVEAVGDTLDS